MLWYIELQFHTRMPYKYLKKKPVTYDKFAQFPATLKSLSTVTTIHVRLTLSCISLGWIESNFAFGPVVSFAIHVTALHGVGWSGVGGVGGRAYQVLRKDALWGSNPATLSAMAIYYYCLEYWNPWVPLLYGFGYCPSVDQYHWAYVAAKYRIYILWTVKFPWTRTRFVLRW